MSASVKAYTLNRIMATSAPPVVWRNRIVACGEEPAKEFLCASAELAHSSESPTSRPRRLVTVGLVQGVIQSARSGHLIDGHQRVLAALKQSEDTSVPYVNVDLTDDEERLVMATFDPISALAVPDDGKVAELLNAMIPATKAIVDALTQTPAEEGRDRTAADRRVFSDAR